MIRVELGGGRLIGIGFAFKKRDLTVEEGRVLKVVEKVLGPFPSTATILKLIAGRLTQSSLVSTTCTLYVPGEDDPEFIFKNARAIHSYTEPCSRDDNFCKETGRKYSLVSVISECPIRLSKADKLAIWQAYFGRK